MNMGLESALEAYERARDRQYELEQERKALREEQDKENALRWAKGFLLGDVEIAADKVHMLELIDREKGTDLVNQGMRAVFTLLRVDACKGGSNVQDMR